MQLLINLIAALLVCFGSWLSFAGCTAAVFAEELRPPACGTLNITTDQFRLIAFVIALAGVLMFFAGTTLVAESIS